MKAILSILNIIIIFSIVVSCSNEAKNFYTTPNEINFGEVSMGETAERLVNIFNNGIDCIEITKCTIESSSNYGFKFDTSLPIKLYKGGILSFKITFTPKDTLWDITNFIINTDDPEKTLKIKLKGAGKLVPRIETSSNLLYFRDVVINQTETISLEIKNAGTDYLTIDEFLFRGVDAKLFSISSGGSVPITIKPGEKHTVDVSFNPKSAYLHSTNFEISHNAINIDSPKIVEIAGNAIDIDPQIALNCPSTIDFGLLADSLSLHETIEIESTGSDRLTIRDITLQNNTGFKIVKIINQDDKSISFPEHVQPGSKIYIDLEFAPSAAMQYNDKLIINQNATNASHPIVIELNGEGKTAVTQTFQLTFNAQQFTVPAGIKVLKFELWGGSGGNTYPCYSDTIPGKGGYISGLLYVNPGQTYDLYVGGKGVDANIGLGGGGGWNGGGYGGTDTSARRFGGGGGGATDIRFAGISLQDRIIVAGGGGGASAYTDKCHGGAGGGLIGDNGFQYDVYKQGYCGDGGTQLSGGKGSTVDIYTEFGGFGFGGDSFDIIYTKPVCGGGGGAGWYGGGAGSIGGGGGGSSYTDPQKFFDVEHKKGLNVGDGKIIITY